MRCRSRSSRRASSRPRSSTTAATNICRTSAAPRSFAAPGPSTSGSRPASSPSCAPSNASLSGSLDIARATLDALNLRAPVSGQLTAFSIQVGQSLNRGERLGQVDSAGRNKLVASVDEFYLGRVQPGQTATVESGGKTYRAKVAKIYPQVRNGVFEVDLDFRRRRAAGAQPRPDPSGQADPRRSGPGSAHPQRRLLQRDRRRLGVRRRAGRRRARSSASVRLGRRNADYIEVLEGLEPGERVITSPYTGFADKDRLDLET